MSILVIEDEWSIRKLLKMNLKEAGYSVSFAEDGDQALEMVAEEVPDMILLDWMLPATSGIEVLRYIRRNASTKHVPVIMLTARGSENDRVTGLDYGADDYIAKPFSPNELMARVRALLRRSRRDIESDILRSGDIELNTEERRVRRGDSDVHLGPTEFRLLEHFMRNPGRVFSREQLLNCVWGRDIYVEERTVDVHIRRLRKALNLWGKDVIRTVRSMGYALEK
ncbi:MAG: phosphate regulon transcriptional regulator PhoB [Alphaproteobacteria bacterium]|nr:phosphate regulon transcriptional regulator PhoB [Alphaproteobacteria bacterium]